MSATWRLWRRRVHSCVAAGRGGRSKGVRRKNSRDLPSGPVCESLLMETRLIMINETRPNAGNNTHKKKKSRTARHDNLWPKKVRKENNYCLNTKNQKKLSSIHIKPNKSSLASVPCFFRLRHPLVRSSVCHPLYALTPSPSPLRASLLSPRVVAVVHRRFLPSALTAVVVVVVVVVVVISCYIFEYF